MYYHHFMTTVFENADEIIEKALMDHFVNYFYFV